MKVDVHAHCYPKPYMETLRKIGIDEAGGVGIKIPEWTSSEEHIAKMDALGIDIQVLALSAPNVYFRDAELSRDLAQTTNEFLSEICRKNTDRFLSLASVPLNNLNDAVDELHRAINDLDMDGIVLGTNVNQVSLSDDRFFPFLEEVDKMEVPVALHPMRAIGEDLMSAEDAQLNISSNVGFLFETTRTMAQMTFKGTFKKCKNLTFILSHAGGAIPFVYPRWDITYLARPEAHPVKNIPHQPSHYLKRHYYDTALAYYPSSLRCTIDFVGLNHILFGTDAPYTMIDYRAKDTIEKIEAYGFTLEEKEKIYSKNAARLFPRIKRLRKNRRAKL